MAFDEIEKKVIKFVGFLNTDWSDKGKKVFFDSDDEEDMIEAGFFYFVSKDFNNKVEYLLVNPNEGHIKYISYQVEE